MLNSKILNIILSWSDSWWMRIILVIVGAYIIRFIVNTSIGRVIRKLVRPDSYATKDAERKREDTLIKVFSTTFDVIFWIIVLMLVLAELGLNIAPLIAGAGIVGIAVGFGGQYLIRDIISGLFIIIENQYRVGDVVAIDGFSGVVEDINLRVTILRDMDGTVHTIPNGEIKTSSNMSRDFARVNLTVGVGYDADLAKVTETINAVGMELAADPTFKASIRTAPKFLRVDEFGDSAVMIRILGDVEPMKQWGVAGEFRRRLKIAFDREGIEFPFPQRVVHIHQNQTS